jgi:NADPH:quinone reductase-like Zn-dependent oxidoreductase
MEDISSGLGQRVNGTLCRTGVFHYSALVEIPESLTFEEAATLTCSGLTAWNALMGLKGREVKDGDWILVQGTGGVSVAALQVRNCPLFLSSCIRRLEAMIIWRRPHLEVRRSSKI